MSTVKHYARKPLEMEGGFWYPDTAQGAELIAFFESRGYQIKVAHGFYLMVAKLDDIIMARPGQFVGISDQGELLNLSELTVSTTYEEKK